MSANLGNGNVQSFPKDLVDFQRTVWTRLPIRKYMAGHNKVFDIVAVVVQEWPEREILSCHSGETAEVQALQELARSCKRHLALVYGDEWDGWAETLGPIIWQAIWVVLQWYRQKPDSRKQLSRWKFDWVHRYRSP